MALTLDAGDLGSSAEQSFYREVSEDVDGTIIDQCAVTNARCCGAAGPQPPDHLGRSSLRAAVPWRLRWSAPTEWKRADLCTRADPSSARQPVPGPGPVGCVEVWFDACARACVFAKAEVSRVLRSIRSSRWIVGTRPPHQIPQCSDCPVPYSPHRLNLQGARCGSPRAALTLPGTTRWPAGPITCQPSVTHRPKLDV